MRAEFIEAWPEIGPTGYVLGPRALPRREDPRPRRQQVNRTAPSGRLPRHRVLSLSGDYKRERGCIYRRRDGTSVVIVSSPDFMQPSRVRNR